MGSDIRDEDLRRRLGRIVGAKHVLGPESDTARYSREWRGLFTGRPLAVVRPETTAEVAAVVRLAADTRTPIVPQGGNTGLVGAQVPDENGREIVLSLERMNRIRALDAEGATLTAEAGATLLSVQEAAEAAGLLFPLSLASEGSATIGGAVATNAGGTAVIAYGNTRDLVLGLEVVTAEGEIWDGLRTLRKDNTGYDLRHLFLGSEGTLGIVTAACLRLFPRPKGTAVAFAGLSSPEAALALIRLLREAVGPSLTAFELMPRFGLELVLAHVAGTRDPLRRPHPWYALVEVASWRDAGESQSALEAALGHSLEAGALADAALAASAAQARDFWRLRHAMSEAQKGAGGSIKHDVSVPVAAIPDFLWRADAAVSALVPGIRPCAFGHMGDGNIHYNLSQPEGADTAAFLARWTELNAVVHAIIADLGGSISAEHGIGRLKRDLLPGAEGPVAIDLMRRIKAALDPKGILSPGRVL